MAEMKNLKVEVVRYNPEPIPRRTVLSMKFLMMKQHRYWTRWATSKITCRQT